jgi:hypothetical protein
VTCLQLRLRLWLRLWPRLLYNRRCLIAVNLLQLLIPTTQRLRLALVELALLLSPPLRRLNLVLALLKVVFKLLN